MGKTRRLELEIIKKIRRFWFLVTFGNKVTKILCDLCLHLARQDGQDGKKTKENHGTRVIKILKYYLIFVYILQGKDGKNLKENHATKVTKIPKTKDENMG